HSYSHPFFWSQLDDATGKRRPMDERFRLSGDADRPFNMPVPNYEIDVDREILGSIDYINSRLAPPNKKVEMFLWTGDAWPNALALRRASDAGVLNMNGGSTIITRRHSSWTNIAPYGVAVGDRPNEYQVYAATMNENVYTGDWEGPFYGFERVLETFEMTDRPIRFKALDI